MEWVENIVKKKKMPVTNFFSFFHNVFKSFFFMVNKNRLVVLGFNATLKAKVMHRCFLAFSHQY